MTAINCYLGPDAAHIFSDGGFYDMADLSRRKGTGNKVAMLPKFNAVVAASGMMGTPFVVEGFLADRGFESFDELADEFGPFMKYSVTNFQNAMRLIPTNAVVKDFGQFECVLAGWSESKDAPRAVLVREFSHEGVPAFTAKEITEHYSPYAPSMEFHFWRPDDVAGSGLELLRAQHKMKFAVRSGPNGKREVVEGTFRLEDPKTFNVVSGFAQHTRVDRDGITIRVLERWDDSDD